MDSASAAIEAVEEAAEEAVAVKKRFNRKAGQRLFQRRSWSPGAQGIQGPKGDKGNKGDRGDSGIEAATDGMYTLMSMRWDT